MDQAARLDEIWAEAGLSSRRCLSCDVCCRFSSPVAAFLPFFSAAEMAGLGFVSRAACRVTGGNPDGSLLGTGDAGRGTFLCPGHSPGEHVLPVAMAGGCRCPFFQTEAGKCSIYDRRPLDCRLYPLVLMYDELGKEVWLAADEACPFVFERVGAPEFQQAVGEVAELLETDLADTVAGAPGIISVFQEQPRPLRTLPGITRRVCRSDLGLARLVTTCGKPLEGYFRARPTCLTGHAFPAIVLWGDAFNLLWKVEADCLLVLAEDGGVSFLMAPPFGTGDLARALPAARELMAAINGSRGGARVQEVDEELLPALTAAGWPVGHRAVEYVYSTEALASLRGRHFDGKRHDCRRFESLGKATWRRYEDSDFLAAVALLRKWREERAGHCADSFYRAQLLDSGFLHLRTLREAEPLKLMGRVVEVEGQVVAYTFGFPLADGVTFADFIEVADLSYPGLGAFVFREFCRTVREYPYLNAGTDSDLPNLARSKLLYRPLRVVPSYVVNVPQTETRE